jgi:hypothetical protein
VFPAVGSDLGGWPFRMNAMVCTGSKADRRVSRAVGSACHVF